METMASARETRDCLVGTTIDDRYELVELLGEGAAGQVYRARQKPLQRPVAVKLMRAEAHRSQNLVRRFVTEAQVLGELRHPNTVRLIDFGRSQDGIFYQVTEFAAGGTLADLMARGRIVPATALRIGFQLAMALVEAHAHGIIHRDVKPRNILVDRVEGEHIVVKLADFGLAKRTGEIEAVDSPDADAEERGLRLGTPGYMAPEQAFRDAVDESADLYALGVILYEMLTGHELFEADSRDGLCLEHRYSEPQPFAEIAPDLQVDPRVEDLVMTLLAKRADERLGRAVEVAAVLGELASPLAVSSQVTLPRGTRPSRSQEIEPVAPTPSRAGRYLTQALLGGVLVVLLVLLVAH